MTRTETGGMHFGCHDAGHEIRFYGCALNEEGRIGLLLIVRSDGWHTQEWTGESFPNTARGQREADRLMTQRNCRRP